MTAGLYVQYGCGWCAPADWRNFDASPTLRYERLPVIGRFYVKNESRFPENVEYGDIVHGLPLPDGSCRGVYCSHVLEHLALEDLRRALRNTHRILGREAVFRLVMPDLEHLTRKYLSDQSPQAALAFMIETALGRERRRRGLMGLALEWLGNSQHLWMWDFKSLRQELESAGFVEIRRAAFGDSPDPAFKDVEESERWHECLGVECRK